CSRVCSPSAESLVGSRLPSLFVCPPPPPLLTRPRGSHRTPLGGLRAQEWEPLAGVHLQAGPLSLSPSTEKASCLCGQTPQYSLPPARAHTHKHITHTQIQRLSLSHT